MTGPENQSCQEVNTIINVMSKKFLRRLGMMLIGRSYFYPESKTLSVAYHQSVPQNEQYVMKLFSGFNVSVQPCLMGNLMCIDLVSRVMQEKSCRKHMTDLKAQVQQGGGSKEQYQQRVKDLIVGSTVFCTYNQRVWRIDDIDFTKCMESTFTIEADSRPPREGKTQDRGNLGNFTGEITFYDYFTRRYPEILTRRLLPPAGHTALKVPGLLVNAPKKARTTLKTTILLPELCYLTDVADWASLFEPSDLRLHRVILVVVAAHSML